jgi:hypothetical protein
MTKRDLMPTEKAREMLIAGFERLEISRETGLTMQSIRSIASAMRKHGFEIDIAQKRYEYTGLNPSGHVVKFRSLHEGFLMGFLGEYVSMCVTGKKGSYLGYTWVRREL